MIRIILDRSIFHGERFARLRTSKLVELQAKEKLEVRYTTDFLEETLTYSQINPSGFLEHWEYLQSLNTYSWFKHPDHIVPIELGDLVRSDDYYLRPREEVQRVLYNADKLARGKIFQLQIAEQMKKTEVNRVFRDDFRRRVLETRMIVGKAVPDFPTYFERNVEWFIQEGLMTRHDHSEHFLEVWRSQRPKCPFTEMYLKAWMSAIWIPSSDHTIKVHRNDRTDSHQLSFLIWADIFVSDDKQFMKQAFELLYPPPQKMMMDSTQFTDFILKL